MQPPILHLHVCKQERHNLEKRITDHTTNALDPKTTGIISRLTASVHVMPVLLRVGHGFYVTTHRHTATNDRKRDTMQVRLPLGGLRKQHQCQIMHGPCHWSGTVGLVLIRCFNILKCRLRLGCAVAFCLPSSARRP